MMKQGYEWALVPDPPGVHKEFMAQQQLSLTKEGPSN